MLHRFLKEKKKKKKSNVKKAEGESSCMADLSAIVSSGASLDQSMLRKDSQIQTCPNLKHPTFLTPPHLVIAEGRSCTPPMRILLFGNDPLLR